VPIRIIRERSGSGRSFTRLDNAGGLFVGGGVEGPEWTPRWVPLSGPGVEGSCSKQVMPSETVTVNSGLEVRQTVQWTAMGDPPSRTEPS
jgi:hypothetical protein